MNFLRSLYHNRQLFQLIRMRDLNAKLKQCVLHDFAIIAAQSSNGVGYAGAVTVVLYRCKSCGAHTTNTLLGAWTVADLLRTESEVSELERLAK